MIKWANKELPNEGHKIVNPDAQMCSWSHCCLQALFNLSRFLIPLKSHCEHSAEANLNVFKLISLVTLSHSDPWLGTWFEFGFSRILPRGVVKRCQWLNFRLTEPFRLYILMLKVWLKLTHEVFSRLRVNCVNSWNLAMEIDIMWHVFDRNMDWTLIELQSIATSKEVIIEISTIVNQTNFISRRTVNSTHCSFV